MDVYKIGVNIVLANGMSSVLSTIQRDLLGLNTAVGQVERSFGRWATALGGVAAVLGGAAIFGALSKIADKGRELIHQQELMKIAGMTNKEIAESTARAYEVSASVKTASVSENMRRIRELRGSFGETPDALKYLEMVGKAQTVLEAMTGDKSHGDQVWEMVKAGEMKGLTQNPAQFTSMLQGMIRAVVASGGKITPADFFSAFKYGRSATYGWDDKFITDYLPSLISEMKSGSGSGGVGGPGNALMSMYSAIVSGQMSKTSAEEFMRLGLLKDKDFKPMPGTTMGKVSKYGVTGTKQYRGDPYQWIQNVLIPAIKARDGDDRDKIMSTISRLFKNRTAGGITLMQAVQGSALAGEKSNIEKDARLNRMAMPGGLDAAHAELTKNDPVTITRAYNAQFEAMMESIGSAITPAKLEAMKALTGVFTAIGQFAGAHPEVVKEVAKGLAAFAAALVVVGGVAIGTLLAPLVGPGGLIAGVVVALGTLVALNWDTIKNGITGVYEALKEGSAGLGERLKETGSSIWEPLKATLSKILETAADFTRELLATVGSGIKTLADGFRELIASIAAAIKSAIGSIGSWFGFGGAAKPQQQNFRGAPADGGMLRQANWAPPGRTAQPVHVASTINLDGRTLAQAIADRLVEMAEHPTSAPYFDPRRSYAPPDTQSSTT